MARLNLPSGDPDAGGGFQSSGAGPLSGGGEGREFGNTGVQTRATFLTGGGGGGSAPTAPVRSVVTTPTTPVRPLAPVPITPKKPIDKGNIPREIAYEPPPPPPIPQMTPNIVNPPAKDPQPALPSVRGIKGRVPVTINPQRYKVSGEGWSVSAAGEVKTRGITPIRFQRERRPPLVPLLRADGIVVKIRDRYLVSAATLADIENSGNPHYDIVENGRILETAMGKSVPIIELDIDALIELGAKRDLDNAKAGVRSVAYIYETPTIAGIPEGVIDHINFILGTGGQRPADGFELWNLNLKGDYSVQRFTTYTLGKTTLPNSTIEVNYRIKENDKIVLGVVTTKMTGLRGDLNLIKGCFFQGELPETARRGFTPYTQLAVMDPATGEVSSRPFTIRNVQPIANEKRIENRTVAIGRDVETFVRGESTTAPAGGVRSNPQSDDLNRWRAYGFTKSEVADILRDARIGGAPFIAVANGGSVGIGSVRFGPDLCRKARVVLPLGSTDSRAFQEFYGVGFTNAEYDTANRKRIAELLNLAIRVNQIELKTGKTLSIK